VIVLVGVVAQVAAMPHLLMEGKLASQRTFRLEDAGWIRWAVLAEVLVTIFVDVLQMKDDILLLLNLLEKMLKRKSLSMASEPKMLRLLIQY
jgi:hypothetical protein